MALITRLMASSVVLMMWVAPASRVGFGKVAIAHPHHNLGCAIVFREGDHGQVEGIFPAD